MTAFGASSLSRRMISWAFCRPSASRNTAAYWFIVSPSSSLIADTRRPPSERLMIARIALSVSVTRVGGVVGIGMCSAWSAACSPERRPKISVSSSELAPSRLPPCTDTQATSPAAYRPGIVVWPSTSVLTPPMM